MLVFKLKLEIFPKMITDLNLVIKKKQIFKCVNLKLCRFFNHIVNNIKLVKVEKVKKGLGCCD